MKTTLFVICLLAAVSASAQTASYLVGPGMSGSNVQMFNHPQTATYQGMGLERNLLSGSQYTWAKGERPLWEFATPEESKPLGDVAREYRKEHANAKKAAVVHTN